MILYACILILILALVLISIKAYRIKQRLAENEIRLRTIIDSEPECVKLQSYDGVIQEMNKAGLSLLEANSADEVIGHKVYEFVCDNHVESYKSLTRDVFAGKKKVLEFQVMGIAGTKRWLETNATPLKDKNGHTTALLAITRDITDRKNLENKLQQQQIELHHVCRISTVGEVASGIAHELNQPLCAISSYADTCIYLLQKGDHTKLSEKLNLIISESERASQIISRVRVLATHKKHNKTKVKLVNIINDVVSMTQYYIESHSIDLVVSANDTLPFISADKIQIEQVLFNLIRNAVEAMTEVGTERRLIISAFDTKAGSVIISVTDNGPGIHKDYQRRVIKSNFSTKEQGMGMGLPICRSIINAHGGRFWLDDSVSKGACFCFTIPTVEATNETPIFS